MSKEIDVEVVPPRKQAKKWSFQDLDLQSLAIGIVIGLVIGVLVG